MADTPVDLAHLARYTGGDKSLNAEILRLFDGQISEMVEQLQSIIAQRDQKKWRQVTHTIKGAARGVGAFAMGQAAADAEPVDPSAQPDQAGQALETLLQRGMVPIMTHPERHPDLQKINADLLEWIRLGCLVQITGQSLLGRFGKSAEESAWQMLRRGLAHFVASDAHGVRDRTPRLDDAYAAVSQRAGAEIAEAVFVRNPQAVLAGEKIHTAPPKKRAWYHLLK